MNTAKSTKMLKRLKSGFYGQNLTDTLFYYIAMLSVMAVIQMVANFSFDRIDLVTVISSAVLSIIALSIACLCSNISLIQEVSPKSSAEEEKIAD